MVNVTFVIERQQKSKIDPFLASLVGFGSDFSPKLRLALRAFSEMTLKSFCKVLNDIKYSYVPLTKKIYKCFHPNNLQPLTPPPFSAMINVEFTLRKIFSTFFNFFVTRVTFHEKKRHIG